MATICDGKIKYIYQETKKGNWAKERINKEKTKGNRVGLPGGVKENAKLDIKNIAENLEYALKTIQKNLYEHEK